MKRCFGKIIKRSHFQDRSRYKFNSMQREKTPVRQRNISVRGLPEHVISNSSHYWRARRKIHKKALSDRDSWLDEYEEFNKLHNVSYNTNSEIIMKLNKHVEDYLSNVEQHFIVQQSESDGKLAQKLALFKKQWMSEHKGSDPDGINMTGNETEEMRETKKTYDKMVKTLKREHTPTVYAAPGTSNFDYFCNSIRLLALNKTICFCFDAEAFEFDTNMVTEIGISIYDPRENLCSSIPITRNYHIIISEALTIRNTKFVCDSKDCYQLGESLVLSLDECIEFVQHLVNFYLQPKTEEDKTWSRALVGHNVQGDITWLKQLGIKLPSNRGSKDNLDHNLHKLNSSIQPIFVLDTEKLYRFTYGNKGGSLGKLLRLLRIPHSFLHNAGNDAYYTLQLILRMCDINYRKQNGLDNIAEMDRRIEQWLQRDREEPKVLPMSYSATIKMLSDIQNQKDLENSAKKKHKNIVHQTEFGGSQWYSTAREAFNSTLR